MKFIVKLVSVIITILYFLCATIGSLLVIPCRLLGGLSCLGGTIVLIDVGISNWEQYFIYFLLAVLFIFIPSFIAIYVGKFLLWVNRVMANNLA